ncbi:MAG: alpha/beta hydrolase [Actinomycetia bacterium]|nr:alpha/beta hydrolase [Actinomycetes bacterium]
MPRAAVTDDIELEYEVFGTGVPLYLVMGLNTQMVAWPQELIDDLVGRGYQVVRMDNRDIGLSSKTAGPPPARSQLLASLVRPSKARPDYLIADMANDVVGLMDHLEHKAVHLVGVSMGGMIAQQLTIDHPERVLSLCSIMSTTGAKTVGRVHPSLLPKLPSTLLAPPPKEREARIEHSLRTWRLISGPHFDEAHVRAMVSLSVDRSADTIGGARQLIAIGASPDRTKGLRKVSCPTLVIHGLKDRLVTPSGGVATARAIRHSRLLMFPDMAHDLPAPRVPEIVEAIDRNAQRAG